MGTWEPGRKGDKGKSNRGQGGGEEEEKIEKCPLAFIHSGGFSELPARRYNQYYEANQPIN